MKGKAIKGFLVANWWWLAIAVAFVYGIKNIMKIFTNGFSHLDGSYEETQQLQQDAVDNANEAATHGDAAGFGDNAIVIADQLFAQLNTTGGVDFDACVDLVKDLSYQEGAAVYGAFGMRAFTVMGIELWEGNLMEWIVAADTWTITFGGADSDDFIDAYEYLSQTQG